jgi:hypothetical protein
VQRRTITLAFLLVGVALVILSYFFLAAPLGSHGVENSNPRMQFAPALLVLGVILTFSSAVVYELLPDRSDRNTNDSHSP